MEKNNRLREMLMAAQQKGSKPKKPEVKVEGASTGNASSENGPAINSEQHATLNTQGGTADYASLMLAGPQAMQAGPVTSSPPHLSTKAASTASTVSGGEASRSSPAPSMGSLSDQR